MTEHMLSRCLALPKCTVEMFYTGAPLKEMKAWLGTGKERNGCIERNLQYHNQPGGGLGARLEYAFNTSFQQGYEKVVVLGCDIPGITTDIIRDTFAILDQRENRKHSIVLGPAEDGGYYLVAFHRDLWNTHATDWKRIFTDDGTIKWGSEHVRRQTIQVAEENKMKVVCLKQALSDVDEVEDLAVFERECGVVSTEHPLVSIVMPVLNERAALPVTLRNLVKQTKRTHATELIVVDGGSTDGTFDWLSQDDNLKAVGCVKRGDDTTPKGDSTEVAPLTVQVVQSEKGRGKQQNTGVKQAQGEFVFLLHADSVVPTNYDEVIRTTLLQNPHAALGAFSFAYDPQSMDETHILNKLRLNVVSWSTNRRCRWAQLPYGDQGLFFRSSMLKAIGGVPELTLFEDFELVTRLRDFCGFPSYKFVREETQPQLPNVRTLLGDVHNAWLRRNAKVARGVKRVVVVGPAIQTSARRWINRGIATTTLLNWVYVVCWTVGVPVKTLTAWYYGR
eukprot:TRINITY_DN60885_c0_g1_i1.p1 TRINITY_DN60885_c0_g1~~TRINITY_DN60885_c0_g1_i1.p1  ORF type:complete len:592 (+),score=35.19 TRINITY_DN60885_c0_g1_i1:263-1777(+)